ncbi:hypothetical protein BU15DRAFT_88582 [Melanogaster broomeanus]|nr:hypothetical protein BU15DRAFT_88582 [Melanogaster broomeanus]
MSSFPNELWMNVFEELDSPSDLAAVVRTNKLFRSLGQRILYNHVIWTDPRKFVENYPFLHATPALHAVPRTLTLGISQYHTHNERIEQINRARGIMQPNGDITHIPRSSRPHDARVLEEIGIISPIELLASENLTQVLYKQAVAFTNLRELNFKGMDCTAPMRPVPTLLHPRNLPITELTILGVRGSRDPRELRSFGEAQQLRIIRFDWTCYIYKHFCDTPNPAHLWPQAGANPTPSPHIHTIDVKFPTQKSWQSYISEPHDQLLNPFIEFLGKLPRVTNLRIRNHLPWLRLPDSALPNLTNYQGPLTTVRSVVSGSRRIRCLNIRDPSASLGMLEKTFRDVDVSGGGVLEGLSDMVLGMGAHFFGKMPNLSSVRVFRVRPSCAKNMGSIADRLSARGYAHRSIQLVLGELISAEGTTVERGDIDDSEFEEAKFAAGSSNSSSSNGGTALRELINAWNRYCPALREVQLKVGYVWRRAGEGDGWTQRKIRRSWGTGPRSSRCQ